MFSKKTRYFLKKLEEGGGFRRAAEGSGWLALYFGLRRMCGGLEILMKARAGTYVARWPGQPASFVDRATRRPFGPARHSLIKRNQSVTPAVCMYTCR